MVLINKEHLSVESYNWAYAAILNALTNPELAVKQAKIASSIQTKARIVKSLDLKLLFCKKCKEFHYEKTRKSHRAILR